MSDRPQRTAAVVRIDLAEPLETVRVDPGYDEVLLIVSLGPRVLGQVFVQARASMTPELQWRKIEAALGRKVLGALVRERMAVARRPAADGGGNQPTVAVVVCTRQRPDQLDACLASITRLRSQPTEVVVVDNTDGDAATAEVCRRRGARHVVEPLPGQTRARNRGLLEVHADLVAFTDDDCVVDPSWLERLGETFADPMVMCVTGYIGPLELETPAQYMFERHGGFQRPPRRTVYDMTRMPPLRAAAVAGAGANMIFRRASFAETGNFAEDLGPGTPARSSDDKYQFYRVLVAGYRIAYEPDRVVWHRHRRDMSALRRIFNDYGVAEFAYTTRCLLEHRDPSALYIWGWWLRHIAAESLRAVGPGRRDFPLSLALAELRGALAGPRALRTSVASRADIPPLPPPAAVEDGGGVASPSVANEPPRISVAIATYNRRDRVRGVLEALAAQDLDEGRYEVVVVVDGSTDGTADMARAFDSPYSMRIVEQPNQGLAASRNRGAREAAHPVVLFLDDDIYPAPQAVRAHAAAHAAAAEPHYALGYYPPLLRDASLWAASVRLWWEDHFRRKDSPDHKWTFVDVVDGNSSIHVDQLRGLGGFDERYAGGRRQDYELGIRLLERRVPIRFHKDAIGWHHLDAKLDTAFANAREEGRYDVLLGETHPGAKGRLLLGMIAERYQRPRRAALFHNAVTAQVNPEATLPLLQLLERLRLRRRWAMVLDQALVHAYALGAMEACGGWAALREFLSDVVVEERQPVDDVRLDAPAPFALPVTPRSVDLQLAWEGRPVASIEGLRPNRQWDWDDVLQRVEDEATGPLALRLAVDELVDTDQRERG